MENKGIIMSKPETSKNSERTTTGIDKEDKIKLGMGEVGIKNNGGMYRNMCVDI